MKSTIQKLEKAYSKVNHNNSISEVMTQPHKTNTIHESDVRRVSKIGFWPSRSKLIYQNDNKQCHEDICNRESYKLCLINHLKSTLVQENEYTLQNTENKRLQKTPLEKSHSRMDPFGFYNIETTKSNALSGFFEI